MGQIKALFADLHTHSLLSDGVLLPSELVRRFDVAGFDAIAITDHADSSNVDLIVSALSMVCKELNKYWRIRAIPGVELTHIPLQQFSKLTARARKRGAMIVVGHGETTAEPVIRGSNKAAVEAGVDILAHPGKISKEDALLAAKKGVLLEITARHGHSATNRHVASIAKKTGARLVINSDSHSPDDIPTRAFFNKIAKTAGLVSRDILQAFGNAGDLIKKIG